MSSAFHYQGSDLWTSSATVEYFLKAGSVLGARRYGADHPVVSWLRKNSEGYFMGMVLFIDGANHAPGFAPAELLVLGELLEGAAEDALKNGEFTPLGVAWIEEHMLPFARRLKDGPSAPPPAR